MRSGSRELETLLIERTVRPEDPASGQVALPGGRVDPSDPDLRATALRELSEEVALGSEDVTGSVRYVGTAAAPRFRMNVGVFAAELGPSPRPARAHSPAEVAHVFWLPQSSVTETQWVVQETSLGPREVPASVFEGHVLWGFTRRVLRHFFARQPFAEPDEDDRAFAALHQPREGSLTPPS